MVSGQDQSADKFTRVVLKTNTQADPFNSTEDAAYDQRVRELALDKRAQPKDRTKTEEELAIEAKEALEKAEKKRLKRMNGDDDSDEEESGGEKKRRKRTGGDDLEDDFDLEEDNYDLGPGLNGDIDAEDVMSEDEDGSSEASDDDDSAEDDDEDISPEKRQPPSNTKKASSKELPFTFPCPETHDQFLAIVENVEDKDIPTVIQRVRTLYHPSLAEGNKIKLGVEFLIPLYV